MKFPKIFLNHLNFNRRRLCQNWNGAERLQKELLRFNKWERLLPVHNASFAISDLRLVP